MDSKQISDLPDETLLKKREVAALVRMHPRSLDKAVREGRFPPPIRFGPRGWARWRLGALRAAF